MTMKLFPGDSKVNENILPDGMTTEQVEHARALVLELNALGLGVIVAATGTNGKTFALAKGDSGILGGLLVAVAAGIQHESCPCPTCQARRGAGSARA